MIVDLSWDPVAVAYRAHFTRLAHIAAGPFLTQEHESFVAFVHAVSGLLLNARTPVKEYTCASFPGPEHDALIILIDRHNQSIRDS